MSRWIDGKWLLNFFVEFPDDYTLTIGNLRAVINDAPSVIPTAKEGEWIKRSSVGNWECSLCGSDIIATEQKLASYNYCPICGKPIRCIAPEQNKKEVHSWTK